MKHAFGCKKSLEFCTGMGAFKIYNFVELQHGTRRLMPLPCFFVDTSANAEQLIPPRRTRMWHQQRGDRSGWGIVLRPDTRRRRQHRDTKGCRAKRSKPASRGEAGLKAYPCIWEGWAQPNSPRVLLVGRYLSVAEPNQEGETSTQNSICLLRSIWGIVKGVARGYPSKQFRRHHFYHQNN